MSGTGLMESAKPRTCPSSERLVHVAEAIQQGARWLRRPNESISKQAPCKPVLFRRIYRARYLRCNRRNPCHAPGWYRCRHSWRYLRRRSPDTVTRKLRTRPSPRRFLIGDLLSRLHGSRTLSSSGIDLEGIVWSFEDRWGVASDLS